MKGRWIQIALSLAVVVSFLAAALPERAEAAVTCRTYHWVREGNTKPYIAHTYGLKWIEIAKANNMTLLDKIEIGQRLCIPEASKDSDKPTVKKGKKQTEHPEDEDRAVIQISMVNGRVRVSLSKFDHDHEYLVKARDINTGIGGWYELGYIDIEEDDSNTENFSLPSGLRNVTILNVCLKDQDSDELICRRVVNP